ncbi:MAG: amidohydrolase family protein [Sphingomonadales bacterium]|jgi:hypothetical protein
MTVIDVWGQIPTERMAKSHWMESLLRWTGRSGEVLVSTPEKTLKAMDDAGVDIMFLSAWYGPSGALVSNQEMLSDAEAAPDRFRGLISVDLNRPMDAVREIRDLATHDQVVGVRVVPWLWNLPPNDRLYYPIYTACVDAGLPFCTQVGHTGPLLRSEPGRPIPYLEDVLLDFPELKVVGGHVGFPWVNELTSLAFKFRNLYLDTSAYALHRLPSDFVQFMKGVGQGRVMFGTNWPMLSPKQCLKGLDSLGLDEEAKTGFLNSVAKEVFSL